MSAEIVTTGWYPERVTLNERQIRYLVHIITDYLSMHDHVRVLDA